MLKVKSKRIKVKDKSKKAKGKKLSEAKSRSERSRASGQMRIGESKKYGFSIEYKLLKFNKLIDVTKLSFMV